MLAVFEISRSKLSKFRETFSLDPVFLKPSRNMDVVRVLALGLFLLAPLAVEAAPVEVPELQEFHEAMMMMKDPDNGTDGEIPDVPKMVPKVPKEVPKEVPKLPKEVPEGPEVPEDEEVGPNPTSNSDDDNFVEDNPLDGIVIIVIYILLFCSICALKVLLEILHMRRMFKIL